MPAANQARIPVHVTDPGTASPSNAWNDQSNIRSLYLKYVYLARFTIRTCLCRSHRNAVDAEQIEIDAMLAFLERVQCNGGELPEQTNLSAICRTIARRKAIDALRRCDRAKRMGSAFSVSLEEISFSLTDSRARVPEAQAESHETEQAILHALTKQQKDMLQMYVDGFSTDEIADVQSCSPSTIQRRMRQVASTIGNRFPEYACHLRNTQHATRNKEQGTRNKEPNTCQSNDDFEKS
jgi:RNA polymerase sigma factor (sigma-70 family)